ncbi:hypothetical protein B0H63DRAFT_526989 [Podospora didyma]|uniref:Uncharacterized protein n=1 Tax=Podospora didyma TaxID=330526 RepID=A0AAE0K8L0_9PEZI|nr:hypothetical protein B0H63DRAFT_526989 [Podospora didyma]
MAYNTPFPSANLLYVSPIVRDTTPECGSPTTLAAFSPQGSDNGDGDGDPQQGHSFKPWSLVLILRPSRDVASGNSRSVWMARLEFDCNDLPKLMRDGLRWDSAMNVIRERGFWAPVSEPEYQSKYAVFRQWHLQEHTTKPETECRWVARAKVYAQKVYQLSDFKLWALDRVNIESAVAHNQDGQQVFHWCKRDPEWDINCIHDGADYFSCGVGKWWFWPMGGERDLYKQRLEEEERQKQQQSQTQPQLLAYSNFGIDNPLRRVRGGPSGHFGPLTAPY